MLLFPLSVGGRGYDGSVDAKQTELSVVVPAYNEEDNVQPIFERLVACARRDGRRARGPLHRRRFERLDMGTGLRSRADGRAACEGSVLPGTSAIRRLSPPALMPPADERWSSSTATCKTRLKSSRRWSTKWRDGFEVVYGQREEREGETWFKKVTAAAFYRILRGITNVEIPG